MTFCVHSNTQNIWEFLVYGAW